MPLCASLTAVTLDTLITAADYKQHVTEHTTNSYFFTSNPTNAWNSCPNKECKLLTEENKLVWAIALEMFSSDTDFSVCATVSHLNDLWFYEKWFLEANLRFSAFLVLCEISGFDRSVIEAFALLGVTRLFGVSCRFHLQGSSCQRRPFEDGADRWSPNFGNQLPTYGGGTVVKVLCHKSEGRWFDPRWCHWNFSLT